MVSRNSVLFFLLFSLQIFYLVKANYPADISFCIADLKFDGQNIKICEFGQGTLSRFKGYDALYESGAAWKSFWKYLSKFNKPFWFATPENYSLTKYGLDLSLDELKKHNGHTISSLGKLEFDELFQKTVNSKKLEDSGKISSYGAIVIANKVFSGKTFLTNFNLKNPNALLVDRVASAYVNSKYETNELFKHPELQKYRPKSIICECKFHDKIATNIGKKLNCEKYVIKPLNASRGRGIIIVEKRNLFPELKKILVDKDKLDKEDPTYKYWIDSKCKQFLVEEFVSSKNVTIKDKNYDATMRVMFVLSYDSENINIDFLGAYWKLPTNSLDDYGTLTKKHKSNIDKNKKCSAQVDPQDFDIVKGELAHAMRLAYALMLEKSVI